MGAAMLASRGGTVPGKAKVSGDSFANDIVNAKLSPGEIVIPRSHAMNAEKAKSFIDQLMLREGKELSDAKHAEARGAHSKGKKVSSEPVNAHQGKQKGNRAQVRYSFALLQERLNSLALVFRCELPSNREPFFHVITHLLIVKRCQAHDIEHGFV